MLVTCCLLSIVISQSSLVIDRSGDENGSRKYRELNGLSDAISFFAVDRNKKTIGGITGAFKIINVPTIIVMKDGKEVGRVVEYGKTGQWDKELTELLK